MNTLEFIEVFPTEESCKTHFKEQREKISISCQKWCLAMTFMAATKKDLSACELRLQLGHKRYDTI